MIGFENVSKSYKVGEYRRVVFKDCSFCIPRGKKIGVLGGNGAGKSTLLRLISGAEYPNSGRVLRQARVSFPLGFAGNFHPHLSGRQNVSFVARVYGANIREVITFVLEFSELDQYLDMPIQTYSSGMLAKLAFATSLAIKFDIYLIDEITEVGDARFREKCVNIFKERTKESDLIMVSHNSQTIRAYCNSGAVLSDGKLVFFNSVDEAMLAYQSIMGTPHA